MEPTSVLLIGCKLPAISRIELPELVAVYWEKLNLSYNPLQLPLVQLSAIITTSDTLALSDRERCHEANRHICYSKGTQ